MQQEGNKTFLMMRFIQMCRCWEVQSGNTSSYHVLWSLRSDATQLSLQGYQGIPNWDKLFGLNVTDVTVHWTGFRVYACVCVCVGYPDGGMQRESERDAKGGRSARGSERIQQLKGGREGQMRKERKCLDGVRGQAKGETEGRNRTGGTEVQSRGAEQREWGEVVVCSKMLMCRRRNKAKVLLCSTWINRIHSSAHSASVRLSH